MFGRKSKKSFLLYLTISYTYKMHPTKITDQKQPASEAVTLFFHQANEFTHHHDHDKLPTQISEFHKFITQLDTNLLEESSLSLLLVGFEQIVKKLGKLSSFDKAKEKNNQDFVFAILKKLIGIFKVHQTHRPLKTLKAILDKDNQLFYKRAQVTFFAAPGNNSPTPFYLMCLELLKQEMKGLCKRIWTMSLEEIIELFEFFNHLEKSRDTKTQVGELYDEYLSELIAFFQSGRPELKEYALWDKLLLLQTCFGRAISSIVKKQQYEVIIPTLALSLIHGGHRIKGIKLLNNYCKKVFQFYDYSSESDRLKEWLKRHQAYRLILSESLTQEEYEQSRYVLKHFGKSVFGRDKNKELLKLLTQTKNKYVSKFCLKQLELYNIPADEREAIVRYLSDLEDLTTNYPQYCDCIDELVYRMDFSQRSVEPIFNIVYRIMSQAYSSLSQSYQRKLASNLRTASRNLRQFVAKRNNEEKVAYVKKLVVGIVKEINTCSITTFRLVLEEGEMQKAFSNNNFHSIMNFAVEECQLLDRIFQFLEKQEKVSDMDQIVKVIKYVVGKCTIKIDVTHKYLRTLGKFPQLYQSLIASEGYQRIRDQMQTILDHFRSSADFPFHLLKTTFFKANFKQVSDTVKQPSLVCQRKEEYTLRESPTKLEWYEEIISLLQETESSSLRQEIAQFVMELHINYSNNNYLKVGSQQLAQQMEAIIEYFRQNTMSYRKHQASKKSVLANFELIRQMIQFTDILGVGKYRPHRSLVSTSTISLTILNNATFGDDVEKSFTRNLPTNMVLFELLTAAGIAFKCGPEDLVLRQGSRFIPIIYNGCTLEELRLSSEQIVADKNEVNFLKAPQVLRKGKGGDNEFTQPYEKCLKEVFQRFAFEGKMGQIQATNYLRQVSGTYVMGYDRRVREMFEDYDKDKDGILNYEDFLKYNLKNVSHSGYSIKYYTENFLKGLYNLRYRKNITLFNEPLDISHRYHLMMRFKLQKHDDIYSQLLKYTADQAQEVSKNAQQLLLSLPTWATMRKSITQIFQLNPKAPFLNYYKLIMFQDFLSEDGSEHLSQMFKSRSEKIAFFIANRYNEAIFKMLQVFYQNIHKDEYALKSFSICLKILRSLIDLPNLTLTNIQELRLQPGSIHPLPSSTFFLEEALKALKAKDVINLEVLLVLQLTQSHIQLDPLIAGCFSNDEEIRRTCSNFIYLWEQKIKWKDNLFQVKIPQQQCREWFSLLCVILERHVSKDITPILSKIVGNLQSREETLSCRENEVMQGYLQMLNSLLGKYPQIEKDTALCAMATKLLHRAVSPKSRELLYGILIRIDEKSLTSYMTEMLQSVLPSQECEARFTYMGLRNLGATCYINSIIQQFFMIQKFRFLILNEPIPEDCKTVQVLGKPLVDDFMFQLQKMYYHLQFSQKKYLVPKQFCYSYKDFDGNPINTSIQEDSHQFLNRLLQQVEQLCKKGERIKRLQQICEVKTLTELECGQCKNRIDKVENHYSCMLEVKGHDSLAGSLCKFIEKEEIEGYTCEKCHKKGSKTSKRTYFHELPEILILNLQRIVFDPKKGDKIKVHTRLTFPTDIDFTEYIKNSDIQHIQPKYRLKGVVIHTGTSEGGHYYSLIRDQNERWLKFNDQNVVDFDPKEIERQAFGGFEPKDNHFEEVSYSTNAYILFYESIDAKPFEFTEVENVLSQEVQSDNLKLIKEIQVHQEGFFACINYLYQKHRLPYLQEGDKAHPLPLNGLSTSKKRLYQSLLDLHKRAFSFLSVFTSIKPENLARITNNMLELYRILPEEASRFFKQLNIQASIENLVSHSDFTFREGVRRIIVNNIKVYFNHYDISLEEEREESKLLAGILDQLLLHLSSNLLYTSVNKSSSFFGLLLDLVRMSRGIRTYLVAKQLMFYLFDLMMGRQSPFLKHHPKAQDLPNNIVIVIYEIIDSILFCKNNLKGIHVEGPKYAPYIDTSLLEGKILMDPSFYRRVFRLNYHHMVLLNLIRHYSLRDRDYTLMICEVLLQQMNNFGGTDITLFFKILQFLLVESDGLQELRYSCLLGCPQYVEVKINNFCLSSNGKSDNMNYVSAVYPNKEEGKLHSNSYKKPLIQLLFVDKMTRNEVFVLHGLQLLMMLCQASEPAFKYILQIPPPNYHKASLLELVPEMTARMAENQDFIFDKKFDKITVINSLHQIIVEKIKIHPIKLPVKPYIIGKTVEISQIDKIGDQHLELTLRLCKTYVLDNLPTGTENKSMGKHFGYNYDVKGTANLFIDYRSAYNYKPQEKIDIKPSVLILKGHTKQRLLIRVKNQRSPLVFLIAEGDFTINLPYRKETRILELIEIEPVKSLPIQVPEQVVLEAFQIQAQDGKMKEEEELKEGAVPPSEKKRMAEDGIECMHCTFLNELSRERCQVCENPLFL